jgi:hypothetical protein
MTSFADAWKAAGEAQDDYDPLDGSYRVVLVDAGAFTGHKDGKDYAKLKWQIDQGDDVGRRFEDFQGISHPVGLRIFREKLELLGLDPEGIEDIEELSMRMFEMVGLHADVTVGHQNGYRQVKVDRVLTGRSDIPVDSPPPARTFAQAAGADKASDEGIPF